jgi:hypothetical protein
MSRKLDDLDLAFKIKVFEFLARLTENKISVLIVDTLRTPEEHQQNLKHGKSWIKHSKHIDGKAIDIVPYEIYNLNGEDKLSWNADHPIWIKIGTLGESLGLTWGGRWKQKDMGHFEF